jgi:hypothetical protein
LSPGGEIRRGGAEYLRLNKEAGKQSRTSRGNSSAQCCGAFTSAYSHFTNRSELCAPCETCPSKSAVGFAAMTSSNIFPWDTNAATLSRTARIRSREAISPLRSVMGPCPGMIFVLGPARPIVAPSPSSIPLRLPPLLRSRLARPSPGRRHRAWPRWPRDASGHRSVPVE